MTEAQLLRRRPYDGPSRRRSGVRNICGATAAVLGILVACSAVAPAAGAAPASGAVFARPQSPAAAACGPAPAGHTAVAVIVERRSQPLSERCAVLPDGRTGLDALRAAGHQVRLDGGFVCAIDGYPETGCGTDSNFTGSYWRYWHAAPAGDWTYSRTGAGGYRLPARCAVEGWVWNTSATDNPPPSRRAPALSCDLPPVIAPTTTPPPAPTVAPQPPPGPGPTVPPATAPGVPGAGGTPPGPSGTPTPQQPGGVVAPGSDAPPPEPGSMPGPEADGETGTPEVLGEHVEAADGATAAPDADVDAEPGVAGAESDRAEEAAAGSAAPRSGGSPAGIFVAVALVAVLAAGAVTMQRRRRQADATESVDNA